MAAITQQCIHPVVIPTRGFITCTVCGLVLRRDDTPHPAFDEPRLWAPMFKTKRRIKYITVHTPEQRKRDKARERHRCATDEEYRKRRQAVSYAGTKRRRATPEGREKYNAQQREQRRKRRERRERGEQ